MVGLLDVADVHEVVLVRGKEVTVTGISGRGIAHLLEKFPTIRKLIAERDDVKSEDIATMAPEAIAAAIAAGCGLAGDPAAEKLASELAVGEQLELLEVIVKLTFPQGFGPFVEKLTRLAEGAAPSSNTFAENAPGREPGMRLPERSKK